MTAPICDLGTVSCERCKRIVLRDSRETVADSHVCVLCVQDALHDRVVELERANRVMATNDGRLRTRLADEQTTIAAIERACLARGYDPDAGEFLADWLAAQLDQLEKLRRLL